MAMAVGLVNDGFSWTQRSSMKYINEGKKNFSCVALSANLTDQYKKLRIQPGASESEVKKAFRQLALQYHPDVCKGNNCSSQFQIINEAYDKVMSYLRGDEENTIDQYEEYDCCDTEDLWEEWMGWEGAGIRDYSSHINPYI